MTQSDITLFSQLDFTGEWRDYQARVLEEFEHHLADDRIHLVAAPGSGKTVIGLEIVRRIGRRALVLAPTRTIRSQWASRLVPLFCQAIPDRHLSQDIDELSDLTITTYQALHAVTKRPDGLKTLVGAMAGAGPMTLVLDEAHHLRREWWNALQELIEALPDIQIIALTATPPYDASFAEWSRYNQLCGPIDIEVSVPELVRNGDLCPHQDHVMLLPPSGDVLQLLNARNRAASELQAHLLGDDRLLDHLEVHPWLTATHQHEEEILDKPELLSAIAVLLHAAGRHVPKQPLELLGVRRRDIPDPDRFWLSILLTQLIFGKFASFKMPRDWLRALKSRLTAHDFIQGKRIELTSGASHFKLLAGNVGKLDGIAEIARTESANLSQDLRMVVLSDFVRASDLPKAARPDYRPVKLGVVPIFVRLAQMTGMTTEIGALTGSLVVIPRSAKDRLLEVAAQQRIDEQDLGFAEIKGFSGHYSITAKGAAKNALNGLITELFLTGAIRILVGTQALLGEGWDAPAINSLVLASNSAAFMLSNQMRGRAIRIDPKRPDKVANIWHLATVEPDRNEVLDRLENRLNWGALDDLDRPLTSDADMLRRRFKSFEGIAATDSVRIESGLDRLALDEHATIAQANAATFALAADRARTAQKWQKSLGDAAQRAHVREVAAPNYTPRRLVWGNTLQALATSGTASGMAAAGWQLQNAPAWATFGIGVTVLGAAAAMASAPKLLKASVLTARNGSLEGSLYQTGRAVIDSLAEAGIISDREGANAQLSIEKSARGQAEIVVREVSRAAEREILIAVSEILGPIRNPRYILVRKTFFGLVKRRDYHAVPTALARHKNAAEAFTRNWQARVGPSELVFCRSAGGRRILLKARSQSLSAGFQRRVDRFSAWV